jgi:hypothetical protein
VDLLEWATERGIKVNPALYKMKDLDNCPLPTLSQALDAGGVHCGVPGSDTETVLRNVVTLLNLPPEVDPDFILQVLLAREAMGTTAIGDGIPSPCAQSDSGATAVPKIALCSHAAGRLPRPWTASRSDTLHDHFPDHQNAPACSRNWPSACATLACVGSGPECSPDKIIATVREIENDRVEVPYDWYLATVPGDASYRSSSFGSPFRITAAVAGAPYPRPALRDAVMVLCDGRVWWRHRHSPEPKFRYLAT